MSAISVKFYDRYGRRCGAAEYSGADEAFTAIAASGRDAIAHPVGTTAGAYVWDVRRGGHTLEGFKAKLAMCCNDPAEYSTRLIVAGICRMPVYR
jgi:hypothetical protein